MKAYPTRTASDKSHTSFQKLVGRQINHMHVILTCKNTTKNKTYRTFQFLLERHINKSINTNSSQIYHHLLIALLTRTFM